MSDEDKKVEETVEETTPETTETPAETPAETEAPAEEATSEEAPAATEESSEAAPEEAPADETPAEPAFKTKLEGFKDLRPGQTVRLHERIKDVSPKGEERERIQIFEGIILAMGGSGIGRTITLRKVSKGFGVEKIYPVNSPVVAKIELVKTAKVRRAKLNYLKNPKRRFKRKLKETLANLTGGKKKKKKK